MNLIVLNKDHRTKTT